jgi:rfaE bifunctional protein kinase chain/domain
MSLQRMIPRLGEILERTRGKRIVVAGDILADEYVYGETARVSREAPVLILRRLGSRVIPGGAGNAVLNVRALGGVAIPVAVLGEGEMAERLRGAFQERGIDADTVVVDADARTVRKTRIMGGGPHGQKQQVLRLDDEDSLPLTEKIEHALIERLVRAIDGADGVLLSDYGYGTLTPRVRAEAIEHAKRRGIPIAADSRYELLEYRGVTWATPNESEAADAVRRLSRGPLSLVEVAERLRKELAAEFVLVTCGQDGMVVVEKSGASHEIPIWGSAEAADVTGAGDTVAAAVLLAVAAGASPLEAASLATVAAGIVVQKHGAATTTPEEIERIAGIRRKAPLA